MNVDFLTHALELVLTALALVFVLDGLLYAIIPNIMKKMMLAAAAIPNHRFRFMGTVMAICGAAAAWMLKIIF
jgi:uncharacterized protein YjeT (DUF2065 family)